MREKKTELPFGWRWDPEGVGACLDIRSYKEASPTRATMERAADEVLEAAWDAYHEYTYEAFEEGRKHELADVLAELRARGFDEMAADFAEGQHEGSADAARVGQKA